MRAAIADHPEQATIAADLLRNAEIVAVTLPTLCEFVWVLARGYGRPVGEIFEAVERLVDSAKVRVDRPAVSAGLAVLEAGGDFADGIIAFEGRRLGGLVFTSFDRRATELIAQSGGDALLLQAPDRSPARSANFGYASARPICVDRADGPGIVPWRIKNPTALLRPILCA